MVAKPSSSTGTRAMRAAMTAPVMAASSWPPRHCRTFERIAQARRDARFRPRSITSAFFCSCAPWTPVPGPAQDVPLPPNKAAAIAAALVVLAMPISPSAEEIDAGLDAGHAIGHGARAFALRSSPALG